MKLELKHLAPYVPYMLDVMTINNRRMILMSASLIGYYDNKQVTCEDNKGRQRHTLTGIKPILRPLSDALPDSKYNFLEQAINKYKRKIESPASEYWGFYHRYTNDNVELNILEFEYWFINLLFEHHFDIFELIPKGLAIDINTLNKQL